ncbi:MAG TPA: family 10 glycosylhydrolase [Kiritimatiellia bacterium]|mgnify:CR=1 FL=1|nr:family 10 glycosylhydrolase [Kiritimatiellia bacterium]
MKSLKPFIFTVTVFLCAMTGLDAQVIDTFRYGDSSSAAKSWRPVGDSPPPKPISNAGLQFTAPFASPDRDRVYWDRDGEWNFQSTSSFELELTCPDPSAFRSFAIYFRSGKGWYVWNHPLPTAGRQKLILQKGHFSIEGTPTGWNKIDRIRISPWKGEPRQTEFILHQFNARRDGLYLIQATDSAPNATERNVARRTTERMSRWLRQSGVPHSIVTEDQLANVAHHASILVFPYNTKLPANGIKELRPFIQRGGKLMVFYSSDDQLAKLMGVQLGAVTNTRDIAQWRGMQFGNEAPAGVPHRIHQQSWNIGHATPSAKNSRIIAWWMNANGRRSADPAVIATPNGYWFTHILLDDDNLAKQRMLSGLLASLDTAIWKDTADHAMLNAGKVDGWSSAQQTMQAIQKLAERHPNEETISAFIRRSGVHLRNLQEQYQRRQFRDATLKGYELTDLLIRAYALAQRPVMPEFRGMWNHDATGRFPGDWDRTAKLLADSGINAIFINATWAGLAHYQSKHLPQSFTYRFYGDQLAQCIAAARKHGLEVHAWIVCWYLENSPAEFSGPLKKTDRLQHGSKGNERMWMNPAHPENVKHHLDVIREILANYDVDGIHLDYIRYPDSDGCFSAFTRRTFQRATGKEAARWPQDVLVGGPLRNDFIKWRADVITDFVRQAGQTIRQAKPKVKLSTAVWGGYPDVISSIGQDWGAWLRAGLVDFITPMNYANELSRFNSLLEKQLALPGARGRIYPGIGVTANESQLRGDQVIEQVLASRRMGAGGFVLFDLSQTIVDDTLPALRMGTTKP